MQDSRWGLTRAEWQNHLPRPPGHASLDAAQDMVGLLGCKHTLMGHLELLIDKHHQIVLLGAAFNPFSTQPVFVLGIALTRVKELALGLVELREVHMGPPLKPAKVLLDGMPSLPSSVSATPHSLVSLGNLLKVHSIPLSILPTKMLNSTSPNINP